MTKNEEGREVAMTRTVRLLLEQCVHGKKAEDFVLTRRKECNGKQVDLPVRDMRDAWKKLIQAAGLPKLGHDMRRSSGQSAACGKGVPESVVMATGGWKTAAMFRRYAIVSSADQAAVVEKLEASQNSPDNSPDSPKTGHEVREAESRKPS